MNDYTVLSAVGGLGLFLIGMMMLTDGLRALAGGKLRNVLRRSTRNPLQGAISGAFTTAMVQSSSATTVAAVGFVAAGLLTFQQSLGIIFGANIGTTITGWLIAVVGFKLNLGTALMPFALIGILLKLFSRSMWSSVGLSLAGFSVLFIGISAMQAGMHAFEDVITPERFPSDTLWGRLQLVGLGILITIVTQSSSAGVAGALAALAAGVITFPQAAAMVIGMDVGTTFTAALATVGGSTEARRTGFAHVIYNFLTGLMAFLLLYPLDWLYQEQLASGVEVDSHFWLVGFHTSFNLLGVVVILGATGAFARFVIRIIPEKGRDLTRRLSVHLQRDADAATDAVRATLVEITGELFQEICAQLESEDYGDPKGNLDRIHSATKETREFLEGVNTQGLVDARAASINFFHSLDHLDRLRHRCLQTHRILTIRKTSELAALAAEPCMNLLAYSEGDAPSSLEEKLNELRVKLRNDQHTYRAKIIQEATLGELPYEDLTAQLDAVRWLHRSVYHAWRIMHHMSLGHGETIRPSEMEVILAEAED